MEMDRLSSLTVEAMAEGKPTPVQARQDGPRKGLQLCQETPINFYTSNLPFLSYTYPPEIIHALLPFSILVLLDLVFSSQRTSASHVSLDMCY